MKNWQLKKLLVFVIAFFFIQPLFCLADSSVGVGATVPNWGSNDPEFIELRSKATEAENIYSFSEDLNQPQEIKEEDDKYYLKHSKFDIFISWFMLILLVIILSFVIVLLILCINRIVDKIYLHKYRKLGKNIKKK